MEIIGPCVAAVLIIAVVVIGFLDCRAQFREAFAVRRAQKAEQAADRLVYHRFYKLSGRGRAAYLILCLEKALQFYGQELAAWEWLLQKL